MVNNICKSQSLESDEYMIRKESPFVQFAVLLNPSVHDEYKQNRMFAGQV